VESGERRVEREYSFHLRNSRIELDWENISLSTLQ